MISTGTDTFGPTTNLFFGDGTTSVEAVLDTPGATVIQGKVFANNLTKFGAGALTLQGLSDGAAGNGNITGTIQINQGTLQLNEPTATNATNIVLSGSQVANTGTQLNLRVSGGVNPTAFFNQNVIVAQDVLSTTISVDRLDGAAAIGFQIPSLTANANSLTGQVINFTSGNNFALTILGPTVLNSRDDNGNLAAGSVTFSSNSGAGNLTLNGNITGNVKLIINNVAGGDEHCGHRHHHPDRRLGDRQRHGLPEPHQRAGPDEHSRAGRGFDHQPRHVEHQHRQPRRPSPSAA